MDSGYEPPVSDGTSKKQLHEPLKTPKAKIVEAIYDEFGFEMEPSENNDDHSVDSGFKQDKGTWYSGETSWYSSKGSTLREKYACRSMAIRFILAVCIFIMIGGGLFPHDGYKLRGGDCDDHGTYNVTEHAPRWRPDANETVFGVDTNSEVGNNQKSNETDLDGLESYAASIATP